MRHGWCGADLPLKGWARKGGPCPRCEGGMAGVPPLPTGDARRCQRARRAGAGSGIDSGRDDIWALRHGRGQKVHSPGYGLGIVAGCARQGAGNERSGTERPAAAGGWDGGAQCAEGLLARGGGGACAPTRSRRPSRTSPRTGAEAVRAHRLLDLLGAAHEPRPLLRVMRPGGRPEAVHAHRPVAEHRLDLLGAELVHRA